MSVSTARRLRFAAAYRRLGDGRAAAIEAGYAPGRAAATAARLLRRADLQAALGVEADRAAAKPAGLPAMDDLVRELTFIATADPSQLLDESGAPVPLARLPLGLRRAIAALEITEKPSGERTTKVRFWSKSAALEALARLAGPAGGGRGAPPTGAPAPETEERALSDTDIIQRVLALAAERSAARAGDDGPGGFRPPSLATDGE